MGLWETLFYVPFGCMSCIIFVIDCQERTEALALWLLSLSLNYGFEMRIAYGQFFGWYFIRLFFSVLLLLLILCRLPFVDLPFFVCVCKTNCVRLRWPSMAKNKMQSSKCRDIIDIWRKRIYRNGESAKLWCQKWIWCGRTSFLKVRFFVNDELEMTENLSKFVIESIVTPNKNYRWKLISNWKWPQNCRGLQKLRY